MLTRAFLRQGGVGLRHQARELPQRRPIVPQKRPTGRTRTNPSSPRTHVVEDTVVTDRIDKEAFLSAATCLTQGWYARRAPKEELSPGVEWRFYVGAEIGRLARGWLGAGVPLPRSPVEN